MIFKRDRGPSASQYIQALCREDGLFVLSDVQVVQVLIKDVWRLSVQVVMTLSRPMSTEMWVGEVKAKLKTSLKASESQLSDAQHRIQELELSKNTLNQLATRIDEAEKSLVASQERVQYFEDRGSEQFNQLLAKNAKAVNECERLLTLKTPVTRLSENLGKARVQNSTDGKLLKGVRTALVSQKTAGQQRISNYLEECEKLVADRAVIDVAFWGYKTDIETNLSRLQAFSEDARGRANGEEKELERLFREAP